MDRDIDHLNGLVFSNLFLFRRPFVPLPPHLIGVSTIGADQLEVPRRLRARIFDLSGMCWVTAAMKSVGLKTSKLRLIVGLIPEW